MTDVLVRPSGTLELGTDTAAAVTVTGGGAGGNLAAWLAAAGSPVTLAARVGDDAAGRELVAELTAAGVTCAVAADPRARTGAIAVIVGADGERSMFTDRGASAHLTAGDVDVGFAVAEPEHLHVSGYLFLAASTRTVARDALARARTEGMTVSVDAASAAPLRAAGPAAFLRWITGIDVLLANEAEAAVLTGGLAPAAAAAALARDGTAVAVTRGAAGAVWCALTGTAGVGGGHVPVADTTGAGDAFAAGLLTAWLAGAGPRAGLLEGVRLGAASVRRSGGRPATRR